MSATRHPLVETEFDPETGTHRVYHDPRNTWEASTTVVLSISSLTGEDPTEMLPLGRSVDPDVLNEHVRGEDSGATLTFEFHGHEVSVRDDGRIQFASDDA